MANEKTLSIGTTWLWELFPYSNQYPTPGEFGAGAPGAPNILGDSFETSSLLSDFASQVPLAGAAGNAFTAFNAGQLAVSGPGENATLGLKSFSANRSKGSAEGGANLNVVGQPPKNAYPGVWCCLTTVSPGTHERRVRFIGQIVSMGVTFQALPSGLVTTVTNYTIREWSAVLKVPVRVEALTVSQAMNEPVPYNAATFAANKLGEKKWLEVIEASYNPFQMATLILQLIGAVSKNNSLNQIPELADRNYYETASRMPIIPPALVKRLGIDSDNTNPFASGFVQIINGIRTDNDPDISSGNWNGLFGDDGIMSIEDYQAAHITTNTGRPCGSGVGVLASINESAWGLLTQLCDPAHNEFYTDMLYEIDEFGKERTQPVFIFRDQPFLLKTIRDSIPNDLSKFSLFDTLPRVKLDSRAIMSMGFTNTILNSANLIRVQWTDVMQNADVTKQGANVQGYNLLLPEMLRFGGREHETTTNFVVLDPNNTDNAGYSTTAWWSTIRDVVTAWHAYNYRMGNVILMIKDYNCPISLGHNVEFEFGNFTLVGHVDSINFSVIVDGNGLITNTMQLSLSRVVQKDENGELTFIVPTQFGQLANPETVPETPDSIQFPNFPSNAQLLNGVGPLKGIF